MTLLMKNILYHLLQTQYIPQVPIGMLFLFFFLCMLLLFDFNLTSTTIEKSIIINNIYLFFVVCDSCLFYFVYAIVICFILCMLFVLFYPCTMYTRTFGQHEWFAYYTANLSKSLICLSGMFLGFLYQFLMHFVQKFWVVFCLFVSSLNKLLRLILYDILL